MLHLTYLIILLPLVGFGILLAAGRRLGDPAAGWVGTIAVVASFAVSVGVYLSLLQVNAPVRSYGQDLWSWIPVDRLQVHAALYVDPLSMTMVLFITGISSLIHLYSIGYMKGDRDFPKFFLYMNLFVASMLILVLGSNMLVTFVGWEGVGACSYWLVSFWFTRDSAASAGKKAFIYNRIGDVGFLLAIFLTFERVHSLEYQTIFANLGRIGSTDITAICLLLLVGRRLRFVLGQRGLVLRDRARRATSLRGGGRGRRRGRGGIRRRAGRGRLAGLVLGQLRLVGIDRRLVRGDGLAQRCRLERAERLSCRHLLADGRRHRRYLARHLKGSRGVVHRLDGSDNGQALPDVGARHRGRAVAGVAATRRGPGRCSATEDDDEDDGAGDQRTPMARAAPPAARRPRHRCRQERHRDRHHRDRHRSRRRPRGTRHRSQRCRSCRRSR